MSVLNEEEKKHMTRLAEETNNGSQEAIKAFHEFVLRNAHRMDGTAIEVASDVINLTPESITRYKQAYQALCEQYGRIDVAGMSTRSHVRMGIIKKGLADAARPNLVQNLVDSSFFGYTSAKGANTEYMDDHVICKKKDIDALYEAARLVRSAGLAK